jgi:hypothetical protein
VVGVGVTGDIDVTVDSSSSLLLFFLGIGPSGLDSSAARRRLKIWKKRNISLLLIFKKTVLMGKYRDNEKAYLSYEIRGFPPYGTYQARRKKMWVNWKNRQLPPYTGRRK